MLVDHRRQAGQLSFRDRRTLRRQLARARHQVKGKRNKDGETVRLARALAESEAQLAQCRSELEQLKRSIAAADESEWVSDAEQVLDPDAILSDEWRSDIEGVLDGSDHDEEPLPDVAAVSIEDDFQDDDTGVNPFGDDSLRETLQQDGHGWIHDLERPLDARVTVRARYQLGRASC
ncbi:BZIP domain-containing protein [Plasmodiophora brassicae]|uniref:Uncharacterized protein n=1 Tax=Plasmodiophora brassicae TaxID=37360 RepID=A0A0G4J1X1_PLABS|nr:hypothetical protein PBRA_002133 [Plasmodiophora brassicae]SPQ93194.1 unnamed protein product [Plasmodiophora brassicae]